MQENRYISVPYVSITPTTVTYFSQLIDSYTGRVFKRLNNNEMPLSNEHNGRISKKSYSRIYKRIFTYIYNVDRDILYSGKNKQKIGFITLTLPSSQLKSVRRYDDYVVANWRHLDQEIKHKCLNQLIVELKREYGIDNYIWKAEKQKNGNIHFHMLVDKYIKHEDLRIRWNRIINKLGYVDRYRAKYVNMTEQQYIEERLKGYTSTLSQDKRSALIKRFAKVYQEQKQANWLNPNSTDVHSLYDDKKGKSITNVVAYIAKYMSKDETESRKSVSVLDFVKGRIWYCSQLISNACKVVVHVTDELLSDYDRAVEKLKDVHIVADEYFKCVCLNIVQAAKKGIKSFDKIFADNLQLQKSLQREKKERERNVKEFIKSFACPAPTPVQLSIL